MKRSLWLLSCVLLASVVPASAQMAAGIRAGVSSDPDQFVFGGHVETAPIIEHLSFRPSVEIGLGDHTTLTALNVEFVYSIPLQRQPWRLYAGGGPAANVYKFSRPASGETDISGGFNLLVGVQHSRGLFSELKVGAMDSPTLKFTLGYAFR